MGARNYSSVARATTLTGSVSGSATAIAVTETTGFPSVPFSMVIDPGRSGEEIITVTNQIGLNLTVLRGQDGTAATPHDAGATLRHMATARDFREAADHLALTENVHGVAGSLVGQTDDQVIDNKTFLASLTDHTAITVQAATGQATPILKFSDASSNTTAYFNGAGRLNTPGIDGTSSSTFTAGSAATVPLIAKGAASQSAKLASFRNSASTELAAVGPDGSFATAANVTANTVATSVLTSANQTNSGTAVFSSTSGTTPLVAKQPSGQSANSFAVTDNTDTARAGVGNDAGGYQLFHGGTTNKVPFRIHGGTDTVTMETGASSWGGTISFAGLGFTVAPLVYLSVRQDNESTLKRRVCVNMEGAATTGGVSYRVVQTADQVMPDNTNYTVHWMAMQVTSSSASG